MRKYKRLKNLVVDFGNVYALGPSPQSIFMAKLDKSQRKESNRLWGKEVKPVWRQLVRGEISAGIFWSNVGRTFNTQLNWTAIEDEWFNGIQINRGLAVLISRAKQNGITTAMLTNHVREWFERWRESNSLSEFDYIFTSYELGDRKPEESIYRKMLQGMSSGHASAYAADCLFVDDQPDNVAAAQRLDIESFTYSSGDVNLANKELEAKMRSFGMI